MSFFNMLVKSLIANKDIRINEFAPTPNAAKGPDAELFERDERENVFLRNQRKDWKDW